MTIRTTGISAAALLAGMAWSGAAFAQDAAEHNKISNFLLGNGL